MGNNMDDWYIQQVSKRNQDSHHNGIHWKMQLGFKIQRQMMKLNIKHSKEASFTITKGTGVTTSTM